MRNVEDIVLLDLFITGRTVCNNNNNNTNIYLNPVVRS